MWPTSEVPRKLLIRAARKLDLVIREAHKHTIVEQVHSGLHTQIPRHVKVKRETARSVVEYFIVGMSIPEEKVMDALGIAETILTAERREVLDLRKAA